MLQEQGSEVSTCLNFLRNAHIPGEKLDFYILKKTVELYFLKIVSYSL